LYGWMGASKQAKSRGVYSQMKLLAEKSAQKVKQPVYSQK